MWFLLLASLAWGDPLHFYRVTQGGEEAGLASGPILTMKVDGRPGLLVEQLRLPLAAALRREDFHFEVHVDGDVWQECYIYTYEEGAVSLMEGYSLFTEAELTCLGSTPGIDK